MSTLAIIYHVIMSPPMVLCQLVLKNNTEIADMLREGTSFLRVLRNTRLVSNVLFTVNDLKLSHCLIESTAADANSGSVNYNAAKKVCVVNKALEENVTELYLTSENGWLYYEKVGSNLLVRYGFLFTLFLFFLITYSFINNFMLFYASFFFKG